jgi:hypothetical protein
MWSAKVCCPGCRTGRWSCGRANRRWWPAHKTRAIRRPRCSRTAPAARPWAPARLQARQRTLCGVAAHRFGSSQLIGIAHRAVPGVALHVSSPPGDGRHRQRMARAGIPAAKATAVAGVEMRLLRRNASPFGVGDAPVGPQCRRLAAQRDLGGALGVDVPGMEEVEVQPRHRPQRQIGRLGQAGGAVLSGEAGDVVGRLHRLAQRGRREVRGAGIAAALAEVDRHADRLVAVALDVFDVPLAHRHRQAAAFGHLHPRIAGAELAGLLQHVFDQFGKLRAAVGKAARGGRVRCVHGRHRTGKGATGLERQGSLV